jgi:hypothetical protein
MLPAHSRALDWATVACSTWFIGGLYLDGWAHNHVPELETFFTPWHAVLYSGFGATALVTLAALLRNHALGHSWRKALPAGYNLSIVGALIFVAGGVGDMMWHTVFGIESSVDALLSPTHLALALGGTMLASGPFRAWWLHTDGQRGTSLAAQLPGFLSLTYLLSVLTFFVQYVHPFIDTWAAAGKRVPAAFYGQALGTVSIIVQTALLMGVILLTIRRGPLPLGAATLIFTLNALLINAMHGEMLFVAVAFIGGVALDLLAAWLRPSIERLDQLRLFAFLGPLPLFALYFAALAITTGIVWTIHLWLGCIFIAGVTSWLETFLLAPPQTPAEG